MSMKTLPRIYIAGGGAQYIRMFIEMGYNGAKNVQEADLVVFTGGEDIDPQLYGEKPLKGTAFNTARDERDLDIYAQACALTLPMVGICRGAQLLNVMNGGRLWQHVSDHGRIHEIRDIAYNLFDLEVTSTHHQMMIPGDNALVLATARVAKEKYSFGSTEFRLDAEGKEVDNVPDDVEVIWYEDSNCFCFQPHPEIGHKPTFEYFARLMDDFVFPVV